MGNGSATAGNKVNLTIFGDPKHNNSMIIFFNFCMREKQKEKKKTQNLLSYLFPTLSLEQSQRVENQQETSL